MPIRKYKPTTPGRRGSSVADFVEITRSTPEKSLLKPAARRRVDATTPVASRPVTSVVATSASTASSTSSATTKTASTPRSLTSSTTRTARRASRCCTSWTARSATSSRRTSCSQGDVVESGPGADIKPGNNLPLKNIPVGTVIHAIELKPGGGAKMARSAGASVRLVAKDGPYAQLRLPSGEIRNVDVRCRATIGEVGNAEQSNINWGKAGRMRWKGVRPTVRGVAMNPVDHPHGGGEGKTSGGRHPVSPWGQKEGRTRKRNLPSDKLIVRRRNVGKKRK